MPFMEKSHGGYKGNGFTLSSDVVGANLAFRGGFDDVDGNILSSIGF
jgi:hypothetical protein